MAATTTTTQQKVGWGAANVAVIALALIPVLWMVSLSFKTPAAVLDPSFVPAQWTWGNYTQILSTATFVHPLLNSIGIGLIATFISVVLASMAAYAVARLRFPGKSLLIGMSLLIAMFPIIALVTPLFSIERALGLFDTWPGLIIPYVAFGLPLGRPRWTAPRRSRRSCGSSPRWPRRAWSPRRSWCSSPPGTSS